MPNIPQYVPQVLIISAWFNRRGSIERAAAGIGTIVESLVANDADAKVTPGGQVKYRFVSGSRDQFVINATSGVVTVGSVTPLRYSRQNLYNITVSDLISLISQSLFCLVHCD